MNENDVLTRSIRDYLDTLSDVEADRVLTTTMEPIGPARLSLGLPDTAKCGCLMMTAQHVSQWLNVVLPTGAGRVAGYTYEFQCMRYGVEAVNAAIRDYICELRANRELSSVREMSVV